MFLVTVCAVLMMICIENSNQDKICGPYGNYKPCGSACEATCANPKVADACIDQCVPNCHCNSGAVLENPSGKCILIKDCPKLRVLFKDFWLPLTIKYCTKIFILYGGIPPSADVIFDCYIKKSQSIISIVSLLTLKSVNNMYLVTVCALLMMICIGNSNQDKACGPYGRFDTCGSACAPTCQNPKGSNLCTEQCDPKCLCNSGALLESPHGKCVLEKDCPK
ncbi:hypothetical protein WA026_016460 [Henosepilachna vigintioctopunctata]|uniref:TIL domain-containing protein n=1 Tax=Henosepilachna vigintioctopunctata TaxID=420089 RepID=A0AAW1ULF9_9CUCU